MIKIYFDNKPLIITSDAGAADEYLHRPTTICVDELDVHVVKTMVHEMEQDAFDAGVFLYHDANAVLDAFKKRFTVVQAAGGLVLTPEQKLLMIFRRGKWDLPKGKLDEGEDLATCALREVKEETGLAEVKNEKHLLTTYHTYHEKGSHILKESFWYLMTAKEQHLQPQTDEDITECKWVPLNEVDNFLSGSYGLVKDVVEAARVT